MKLQKSHSGILAVLIAYFALTGCASLLEGKASQKLVQSVSSGQANFKAFRQIRVIVEPDDLDLYREVLPSLFEMPEHPMVLLAVVDYTDVGPWPLTRYQEGYISLRCAYNGEEGWYALTMPVNKQVAMYAGRTMGYPKYLADEITLRQTAHGWRGEVIQDGETRLYLDFVAGDWTGSPMPLEKGWDTGGPSLNLMPPTKGPEVKRIDWTEAGDSKITVYEGAVHIKIGESEKWHGLIKDGTIAPGALIEYQGGGSLEPAE